MQIYIDWLWNHREEIGAWIMSALVATTAAVHTLQRAASAFARIAAKTASKEDDIVAQKLARILSAMDAVLTGFARYLPRIGVGMRQQWSEAERAVRTSDRPVPAAVIRAAGSVPPPGDANVPPLSPPPPPSAGEP